MKENTRFKQERLVFRIPLWLGLFFLVQVVNAQRPLGNNELEKAKAFFKGSQTEKALKICWVLREQTLLNKEWSLYRNISQLLIQIKRQQEEKDSVIFYLQETENALNSNFNEAFKEYFTFSEEVAEQILRQGSKIHALQFLKKVKEQLKKVPDPYFQDSTGAVLFQKMALVYSRLGLTESSVIFYDSAARILKDSISLSKIYLNSGKVLVQSGNYELSEKRLNKAMAAFKKEPSYQKDYFQTVLELARLYGLRNMSKTEWQTAHQLLGEGMAGLEGLQQPANQHLLAGFYIQKADFLIDHHIDSALLFLEKAEVLLKETPANTSKLLWDIQAKKANVLNQMGERSSALQVIEEVISEADRSLAERSRLANYFFIKADIYSDFSQSDSALFNLQHSINLLLELPKPIAFSEKVILRRVANTQLLLKAMVKKAAELNTAYQLTQKLEYLKLCSDTYESIREFLKIERMQMINAEFYHSFILHFQFPIELSLEINALLYSLTRNLIFFKRTLLLAEENKMKSLYTSLVTRGDVTDFQVPFSLLQRLDSLNRNIKELEMVDVETRSDRFLQIINHQNLQNALLKSILVRNRLVKEIEKQYPNYYKLVFSEWNPDISKIQQKLSEEELIIQYVIRKNQLFACSISKLSVNINYVDFTPEKEDLLKSNLVSLRNPRALFVGAQSNQLYQLLLNPILKNNPLAKKLFIIPDGPLNELPFETLVTQPAEGIYYKGLPYLINSCNVLYHYSLPLLLNDHPDHKMKRDPFYGFEPEKNSSVQSLPPDSQAEVEVLSEVMDGKAFLNSTATELQFRSSANKTGIFHLATPLSIDAAVPIQSSIHFSKTSDTPDNDGVIRAAELYGLTLNADLVCFSRFGQVDSFLPPEGVEQFGRAFSYTGVPNLMYSLWDTPSEASQKVLVDFYRLVNQGQPYAEALRFSKLQFLEKADNLTAHPYYWSSFVLLGNNSTYIETPFFSNEVIVVACLMLAFSFLLLLFLIKRRKELKRARQFS